MLHPHLDQASPEAGAGGRIGRNLGRPHQELGDGIMEGEEPGKHLRQNHHWNSWNAGYAG